MIAVLTREAIQLPLGLTLSADSSELPLDRWTGPVRVGAGQVQVGDRSVRISRVVSVAAPTQLKPNRAAAGHAWPRLSGFGEPEPRPGRHCCIERCHSTRTANSSVDRSKSTPECLQASGKRPTCTAGSPDVAGHGRSSGAVVWDRSMQQCQ